MTAIGYPYYSLAEVALRLCRSVQETDGYNSMPVAEPGDMGLQATAPLARW